jgi:integrase
LLYNVCFSIGFRIIDKLLSKKYDAFTFIDEHLEVILLPSFFAHFLCERQIVYTKEKKIDKKGFTSESFKRNNVSTSTVKIILNRLHLFLNWIEQGSNFKEHLSIRNHHTISEKILQSYINEVLILDYKKSSESVKQNIMALDAYFNYLTVAGFSNTKDIFIEYRLKEQARDNLQTRNAVKYITPELRSILYRNTSSIRDELLLKTGAELGLRSKENCGLLMNDYTTGCKKRLGLLSLFQMMKNEPSKMKFEYYLQGKHAKSVRHGSGKSRVLHISRELLLRMEEYKENERVESNSNSFFLNDSPSNSGSPISESRATSVFSSVRSKVIEQQEQKLLPLSGQMLEESHTYHVLRHSFATDHFYKLAKKYNMPFDNVTSTSAVYLAVAKLMGHNAADKSAPITTRIYIRSCHIKEAFEI